MKMLNMALIAVCTITLSDTVWAHEYTRTNLTVRCYISSKSEDIDGDKPQKRAPLSLTMNANLVDDAIKDLKVEGFSDSQKPDTAEIITKQFGAGDLRKRDKLLVGLNHSKIALDLNVAGSQTNPKFQFRFGKLSAKDVINLLAATGVQESDIKSLNENMKDLKITTKKGLWSWGETYTVLSTGYMQGKISIGGTLGTSLNWLGAESETRGSAKPQGFQVHFDDQKINNGASYHLLLECSSR